MVRGREACGVSCSLWTTSLRVFTILETLNPAVRASARWDRLSHWPLVIMNNKRRSSRPDHSGDFGFEGAQYQEPRMETTYAFFMISQYPNSAFQHIYGRVPIYPNALSPSLTLQSTVDSLDSGFRCCCCPSSVTTHTLSYRAQSP